MGKLKFYFAMTAAKLSALGLKILGRNATYLPGLIAVTLCKDFIGYLKKPEIFIAVTGTNGKTTVSNLLTGALRKNGYTVTNNSFGSNVQGGVAAALLLNSTFTGKHKNKVAVIEVDERSSLKVYPYMAPDWLIVNNIMRDSMKRNAHTEFISYIITSSLPESVKLVLNADDIICAQLAPQCKDRTYFGIDAEKPTVLPTQARDIVYCPKCGQKLDAEYIRYNHIGRYRCQSCGFASPDRDFCVTAIDRENERFTVLGDGKEKTYKLINDNITNIFNACGAIALLTRLGFTDQQLTDYFAQGEIVKTRFDKMQAGDAEVTLILAKGQNPVACSRVYNYIATCPGDDKCLLLIVDDQEDNVNNSESTCWLYDCDYTPFKDEKITEIIFAGKRCYDHILRCKMTGVDTNKLVPCPDQLQGHTLVDLNKHKNVYVLYDNYGLDIARAEARELVKKGGGKA
ncbi:MAG: DUF1727 domain-containing protein [Clostridia bacterium]|nr:DUF1727 domain-containing protein [Clostridia bacterium]